MRDVMIWTVARHELRLLARNSATRAIVIAGLAVIAVAAAAGLARARADLRDREALRTWVSGQRHELQSQAAARPASSDAFAEESDAFAEDPGDAIWGARSAEFVANDRGTFVVAPPPPLAAITVGQTDLYPTHYRITARLRASQLRGDQTEHPLALLIGHLDLAFVVVYLLPLAIIALGYDLTAEERRSGVLRLILARPIRLRTIVIGKLLARGAVVAGLVAAIAIAAIAAITITASYAPARLALWIAVASAYAGFWLALAALIDARGRAPAHNALVLTSFWLFAVVLLPAMAAVAIDVRHPFPSRVQLATAVRTATHAAALKGSQLLGRYLEDHP